MLSDRGKYKLVLFVLFAATVCGGIYYSLGYWKYSNQTDILSRDIIFKSDGLDLAGHLFIPGNLQRPIAIILSHGSNKLGSDHILYKEMSERFAQKGYVVLTFDYRGYNKSPDPEVINSADDLDFTMDLMSAVSFTTNYFNNISQVILVGHSFGGGVTVSAGTKDPKVSKIIAISPGRRAEELFFGQNARLGPKWIQRRATEDMELEKPIPIELIRAINKPIIVEYYKNHFFTKPILFIDGEKEALKDRKFLKSLYEQIKANKKEYITIPKADHYFGTKGFTEIKDPAKIQKLVDVIDSWIRRTN